jgi:transcriptional regulator with XRE-family HTH domain
MARINPLILKRQREKLGFSLEDLEARSGIDKGTIYRIEAGKPGRNARNTIAKLANALKCSSDELVATKIDDPDATETVLYSRSQLNVRISHEARNALAFVGQRYGVRSIDIIEFAPLLFHLVAEESLRSRRDSLERLRTARETVSAMQGSFPHITERLMNDWQAEEMEFAEERSIAKRDLRGEFLDKDETLYDVRPMEYDEGEQNPFIVHLRDRLGAVGGYAELDAWYNGWSPRYLVGKEEAVAYFNGDEDVAEDVLNGVIGVHEVPKDLRGADAAEARLAWAREKVAEVRSHQVDLLDTIDLKDFKL